MTRADVRELEADLIQRASFGDQRPAKLRQPRIYAGIGLEKSVVSGNEGHKADAGLARGRIGGAVWGAGGEMVHLGKICGPGAEL